jgi:hypothetical protein
VESESLLPDVSCSVCGATLSNEKQRGKKVARRRLARKPKLRMRMKLSGSRCSRKRGRNSSSESYLAAENLSATTGCVQVNPFSCWIPNAEGVELTPGIDISLSVKGNNPHIVC